MSLGGTLNPSLQLLWGTTRRRRPEHQAQQQQNELQHRRQKRKRQIKHGQRVFPLTAIMIMTAAVCMLWKEVPFVKSCTQQQPWSLLQTRLRRPSRQQRLLSFIFSTTTKTTIRERSSVSTPISCYHQLQGQKGQQNLHSQSHRNALSSHRCFRCFSSSKDDDLTESSSSVSTSPSSSSQLSSSSSTTNTAVRLVIPTVEDMHELGELLASLVIDDDDVDDGDDDASDSDNIENGAAGSVICLYGDIGAGKTVLAGGFVEFATGTTRVTSPTYLLSNTYRRRRHHTKDETTTIPTNDNEDENNEETNGSDSNDSNNNYLEIHHIDLYRLAGPDDLAPLNLDHVFQNCISLIEWPTRLEHLMPPDRLDVTIQQQMVSHKTSDNNNDNDYDNKKNKNKNKNNDSNLPRILFLQPHGLMWNGRIQAIVDEGLVDDWLAEDDDN